MKLHKRNRFSKFVACFLFLIVSFFVTPTTLIHELIHHDDTCDVFSHDKSAHHIGNSHQHCEMLQFSAPPFLNTEFHFFIPASLLLSVKQVESESDYHSSSSSFLFLRGPPAVA